MYDDGEVGVPPTGTFDGPPIEIARAHKFPDRAEETSLAQSVESAEPNEKTAAKPSPSAAQAEPATEALASIGFFGQYEPAKPQTTESGGDSPPTGDTAANKPASIGFFGQYQPAQPQTTEPAGDSPPVKDAATGKPASGGFFAQYEPAAPEQDNSAGNSPLVDDVSGKDLESLTVRDLKDRLKGLGLPVSGRKARLASEKSSE